MKVITKVVGKYHPKTRLPLPDKTGGYHNPKKGGRYRRTEQKRQTLRQTSREV